MAKVYVYKETAGIDEYRVYPGIVILQKNEDFEFVNVSGDEATLKIPAGPFSDQPSDDKVKNREKNTKKVPNSAEAQAVEYQVFVKGKKAKGNSDPVIIIDL